MKSYQELSQKHQKFVYESFAYTFDNGVLMVQFFFRLNPNLVFQPTIIFGQIDSKRFAGIAKPVLDNLIFHIGLIELFSYWKLTAAATIEIKCGFLSEEQIVWWKHLLLNGMGEYIYKNQIPIADIKAVNFLMTSAQPATQRFDDTLHNRPLIPVGGGKDSTVVLNMLKQSHAAAQALLMNPPVAASNITQKAGFFDPIVISRTLDPKLLELNELGYLNGHTPFSALLAFVSVLCGVLFDYADIVLSNEASANQGNMTYDGLEINHQYSKSFAFEKTFHDYAKTYLAKDIDYFSILRPVSELQIASMFRQCQAFFPIFRSCNVGQRQDRWCGTCAKCLFVFTILYPFVGRDAVVKIFGEDLFMDLSLLDILKELLGTKDTKPFECVGTYQEVRSALYLSEKSGASGPLIDYFRTEISPKYPNLKNDTDKILSSWNKENLVPEDYVQILKRAVETVSRQVESVQDDKKG